MVAYIPNPLHNPVMKKPNTPLSITFRLSARTALVGGAIYVTVDQGIWSSSTQDGAKALTTFRENLIPASNELIKQVRGNYSFHRPEAWQRSDGLDCC